MEITLESAMKYLDESKKLSPKDRARLADQKKVGIVTPIVLARALGIKPQMVYNYIREGRLQAKQDTTQHVVIDRKTAAEWILKRLQKEQAKQEQVQQQLTQK